MVLYVFFAGNGFLLICFKGHIILSSPSFCGGCLCYVASLLPNGVGEAFVECFLWFGVCSCSKEPS